MDFAEKETFKAGYTLFRAGERADRLYVLLSGCVEITIGETVHSAYTANHPGEVFGWSSLLGREGYSASAECKEETTTLGIDASRLNSLLEKDEHSGMIFFKRLAGILGNRLLQLYSRTLNTAEADVSRSYGTGQVMETDRTVS
jgi:CRP-like cAMP-binding protein